MLAIYLLVLITCSFFFIYAMSHRRLRDHGWGTSKLSTFEEFASFSYTAGYIMYLNEILSQFNLDFKPRSCISIR